MYLRKSYICHHQLDVQETNVSIAQFYRVWNHFFDAGLRMDGPIALDLLDMVLEVLRSTHNTARQGRLAQGDSIHKNRPKHQLKRESERFEHLSNVDYVPTNTHSSQGETQLYIFEDNEAVIKMIIKGRSPTMRHVSRTHRVTLDWLFDRINWEPNQIHWSKSNVLTPKTNLVTC